MLLGADVTGTVLKAGMGLTAPRTLLHWATPKLGAVWGCLTLAKPLCVPAPPAPSQSRGFPHHENQMEGYRGAWPPGRELMAPGPLSQARALYPASPSIPNKPGIYPAPLHGPHIPSLTPCPNAWQPPSPPTDKKQPVLTAHPG